MVSLKIGDSICTIFASSKFIICSGSHLSRRETANVHMSVLVVGLSYPAAFVSDNASEATPWLGCLDGSVHIEALADDAQVASAVVCLVIDDVVHGISRFGLGHHPVHQLSFAERHVASTVGAEAVSSEAPVVCAVKLHALEPLVKPHVLQNGCLPLFLYLVKAMTDVDFLWCAAVQMGSTTVGLTGCSDYGGVATLLAMNCLPESKTEKDLNWLEAGGEMPYFPFDGTTPGGAAPSEPLQAYQLEATRGCRYYLPAPWESSSSPGSAGTAPNLNPITRNDTYLLRHFLGVMGGQYFRLLDTNLLPDVIVNFQIAQKEVIQASDVGSVSWLLTNASLRFETLNFGDGTYRALVDRRLSQGPITMPFSNFYTFEGSLSGSSSIQTQFTVASQCINGIIATLRPGAYDSHQMPNTTPYAGCSQIVTEKRQKQTNSPGSTYYQFTCGRDPGTHLLTSQVISRVNNLPLNIVYPFYNQAGVSVPGVAGIGALWLDDRSQSPNFQLTVDSKNYPQFIADCADSAMLVKNYFDAGAFNLNANTPIYRVKDWLNHAFCFAIGLDHHNDALANDNLMSGLDTRNSQIPIGWTVNNLPSSGQQAPIAAQTTTGSITTFGVRPFIIVAMTSLLVVGQGRTISTVN